jgi:hypothetical protein
VDSPFLSETPGEAHGAGIMVGTLGITHGVGIPGIVGMHGIILGDGIIGEEAGTMDGVAGIIGEEAGMIPTGVVAGIAGAADGITLDGLVTVAEVRDQIIQMFQEDAHTLMLNCLKEIILEPMVGTKIQTMLVLPSVAILQGIKEEAQM